ncbi:MAG: metal ABC transporter substrate-binding protein [Ilumatobacteraceae bacterium]|jgi:ABC-type Zn uptake system ZnuABC Zn-binding protein ZnuA|nr:metal ABC transporter substrate-binding protein [Ilumatobacteraceae bacterium]
MRRTKIAPSLMALVLVLGACSSGSGSSDSDVSVPDDSEKVDPSVDDTQSKAAMAACSLALPVTGRKVRIVTTVAPITSLVASIAGNGNVEINGIVPEGTNSHTYEPPPSAAAVVEKADIVFVNGLGLEDPTLELVSNVAPTTTVCELGTAVLPKSNWVYDFSFPEEGGKPNPHIWTNPPMVLDMITVIRDVLALADPANLAVYDDNYVKMTEMVTGLDAAMVEATATIPQESRKLLTYHDAYAYFALHFKYTVIGAIQPQSFEEPSTQDIARLIEQVKAENVKAVFGSEVFPSPVLEQIGKEAGVRYIDVLRDDDLLGKPGDDDHSWADLMKFNFITMVDALGGNASALEKFNTKTGIPDNATYAQ